MARHLIGEPPWKGIGARAAKLHAGVDRVMALLPHPAGRLYQDGFGDDLDERVAGVRDYEGPAPVVDIRWGPERQALGVPCRTGRFTSPAARYLPLESKTAIVEQWLPSPVAPMCLLLATTGEEGLVARRPMARWLAAHGIGAVLLENPFYGSRRPAGQRGHMLRTVASQFAMNLATTEEAASLLRTFRDEGRIVGVTGHSQGGMMAAFATAVSDFPVAAVPRGVGRAAAPIFTDAALARSMDWGALAAEAGGLPMARERFRVALEPVRLDRFPPPRAPRLAILVASRHDGFIPRAETEALHHHWAGSELRWVDGGHFSGPVIHHAVHRRALLEVFARAQAESG